MFKPIPSANYPLNYQTSNRYAMTDGKLASQVYPQRKYDKDQHLSSSQRRFEIVSSNQPTIPSPTSTKPVSTGLSKTGASSNLVHDQNLSQRSISLQPSISELKIVSPGRQTENLNVKRPNLPITQQEFREQDQSL